MGRKPCCEKVGLKKGPWTSEEDQKLVSYITKNGLGCWRAVPKLAGLLRCGKSCRLRWTNYLRPDLKRGIFSEAEENMILDLHATLGNRWSRIAAQLPGRTDNEIKNYWNTRLKKRLRKQGLDPATHLPLDSGKQSDDSGGDTDSADCEEISSDAVVSVPTGASSDIQSKKSVKSHKLPQRGAAKGPKPAVQLKVFHSEDGDLVLLKVPRSPSSVNHAQSCKCDDDSEHSSSTGTTKSCGDHHQDLTQDIGSPTSSVAAEKEAREGLKFTSSLSTSDNMSSWAETYNDACMQPSSCSEANREYLKEEDPSISANICYEMLHAQEDMQMDMLDVHRAHEAAQGVGGIYDEMFQSPTCFPDSEIGLTWSIDSDVDNPAPESLYGIPNPSWNYPGDAPYSCAPHPSQELQRLAALLDLI